MKVVNLVEFTCPTLPLLVVYSILRNKVYDFYRAVGESSLPNNAIGSGLGLSLLGVLKLAMLTLALQFLLNQILL